MSAGEDEPVNSSCVHCSEKGRGHTERLLHTWDGVLQEQQSFLAHLFDVAACRYVTSPGEHAGTTTVILCPAKQKQKQLQILLI